jgi:hypothetical protein
MFGATDTPSGLQAPLCRCQWHKIRLMCVGDLFEACGWLKRWCRWFGGLGLFPLGMGLRSRAIWWVSFWVAFYGGFIDLASMVSVNVGTNLLRAINPEHINTK